MKSIFFLQLTLLGFLIILNLTLILVVIFKIKETKASFQILNSKTEPTKINEPNNKRNNVNLFEKRKSKENYIKKKKKEPKSTLKPETKEYISIEPVSYSTKYNSSQITAEENQNNYLKSNSTDLNPPLSDNTPSSNDNPFYFNLKKINSLITKKELILCYLLINNKSNTEISQILNISPGTTRVYKTKIKTKFNLNPEESLVSFLKNIKKS